MSQYTLWQWCGLRPWVLVQDRSELWDQKISLGLARCGLGLAGLVFFVKHDLVTLVIRSWRTATFQVLFIVSLCVRQLLDRLRLIVCAQLPECGAATCSVLSASSSPPVNNMNCTGSAQRHSTRLSNCPNLNSRHSRLGCDSKKRTFGDCWWNFFTGQMPLLSHNQRHHNH